ncbi:MAG TPA: hypothetical protein VMI54_04485 [Polyangiaceae bacterium]|nr:hypothetical protein [Polyangiaceae bacterium]
MGAALILLALTQAGCGGASRPGEGGTASKGGGATSGSGAADGAGAAASGGGAATGSGGSAGGWNSSSPGPHFPGSGTAYEPLTPGCGPESASECTGSCEAHTTPDPNSVIRAPATLCFSGDADPTPEDPLATIEQVIETLDGIRMVHLRVTFDPAFVDNTYGANASSGWGTSTASSQPAAPGAMPAPGMMPGMMAGMMMPPKRGGHTFDDLVGSDHVELLLADGSGNTVMDFDIDYISADSSSTCGYRTLGVTGAEGKVIQGDASDVLGAATSLDRNLNGCGYCYTTDSPATDDAYTPNPATPAWDYRVVYEVWLALDAFGSAGFGQAYINDVHASPSKLDSDTVTVEPAPCPGGSDTPMGSCPANYTVYVETEGKSACVPIPFANYPNMAPCPSGYHLDTASEGKYCIPG